MQIYSLWPVLAAFYPIAAGGVLYVWGLICNKKLREATAVAASGLAMLPVLWMYPAIKSGQVIVAGPFFNPPLAITFRVDGLGFFMALLVSLLWFLAALYSPGYLAHNRAHNRYYALLLITQGGCLGIMVVGDLLGLFLFFELMALVAFVLVSHEEDPYSLFAGSKYLYMTLGGGMAIFFGLIAVYCLTGDLSFGCPGGLIDEPSALARYAFIAFLIGFGVKAGVFPLHVWLPDAHPAAPAPVSALLSGIMIKTGAYGLIRVVCQVYSPRFFAVGALQSSMLIIAAATILLGSALAILQDNLKRRLAYSSIAQIGYIFLGIALLTERAMVGAVFHIFTHAFMKSCLFLCAGLIITQTGKERISELGGIGMKMPLTMACFTAASLCMVGIPPFNGFISKWELSMAALELGLPLLVGLLIVSSLLNVVYYFPIVIAAFFTRGKEMKEELDLQERFQQNRGPSAIPFMLGEAPLGMLFPVMVLAVGCFIFSLFPVNLVLEMVRSIASALF